MNRPGTGIVWKAEVGVMTENELSALRHVVDGTVLFHNGLWGAPAGYRWAAPDGSSAGHVPQWECETLDLLERRKLVTIRPVTGARDVHVTATPAGLATLSTLDGARTAAAA
jgi:hypothetical protein